MRIEFPFAYNVTATTARWRTPREVLQVGFVDATIPHVSSGDAPVCLEWDHVAIHPINVYRVVRHARLHDGGFYIPLDRPGRGADPRVKFDPANLPRRDYADVLKMGVFLDLLPYHELDPRIKALEEWYSYTHFCSDLDGKKDIEISASTEDAERVVAGEAVSRLLVVDGDLYLRVPEPRIELDLRQGSRWSPNVEMDFSEPSYVALEPDRLSPLSPATVMYFRADEMGSLEQARTAVDTELFSSVENVVVHEPGAFSFDRTLDILTRTASLAYGSVTRRLSEMGRKGGNAWWDLEDSMTAYQLDGDRHAYEERVMDSVTTISECLPTEHAELAAELRECVELWSSSDIEIAFDRPAARLG